MNALRAPMFRSQPGFRGALMLRGCEHCLVPTLWHGQALIDALAGSGSYARTVREILAHGFPRGEQSVEWLDVHLSSDLPG
jgi:hypothetical protein